MIDRIQISVNNANNLAHVAGANAVYNAYGRQLGQAHYGSEDDSGDNLDSER